MWLAASSIVPTTVFSITVQTMSSENIQTLFSQLRLEHFHVYLADNGWRGVPDVRSDRRRYELANGKDLFVLMLPISNQAVQCKKLLQRAIYNLSGIEDREPMEIVRDLLAIESESIPGVKPVPPLKMRVRNHHSKELTVRITSRASGNTLMPGEALEIVYRPAEDDVIEIGVQDGLIEIDDQNNT